MHRKLSFENVARNLESGKYRGKIVSADYSNLGIRPFLERKFAGNLGVHTDFLRKIDLVRITNQAGWDLPIEPSVADLLAKRKKIENETMRLEISMIRNYQ